MAVKLRLKRMGRTNHAFFRLNAIDSRSPRDGRVIEELGYYDPRNKDQAKQFVAKLDRYGIPRPQKGAPHPAGPTDRSPSGR